MKRHALLFWLIGLAITGVVMAAAFYFDDAVHQFLLEHRTKAMGKTMLAVSKLGDWPTHAAVGFILAGIAWLRGRKQWTRVFLAMLLAMAIAGVTGQVIKRALPRARPSVESELRWGGSRFDTKHQAFPSGHVIASTAFFGVLVFARRRVGLACLPIPLVIGFSRMYVAAHYLSDVVCAALLGMLIAFVTGRLLLEPIRSPQSAVCD